MRLGTILLLMVITGCGSSTGTDSISSHAPINAGAFPDCLTCHSSKQPSFDPTLTNSTGTAGKHVTHVTKRGIACVRCHLNYTGQATHMNSTMDTPDTAVSLVSFDSANPNGRWINDTGPHKGKCSSLVCHGTDTPDWYGTGWSMPDCSTCHIDSLDPLVTNGSGTAGKHIAHVTDGGFACVTCHSIYTAQTSHMNGTLDTPNPAIQLVYFFDSINPNGQWIDVTRSCSNVYCHSIAQTTTGGLLTVNSDNYKTPAWGGSLDTTCTGCHSGDSAASAKMNSGSHSKHVVSSDYDCSKCHNQTVSNSRTISNTALHVNKLVDIAFDAATNPIGAATYNGNSSPVAKTPGIGFSNCSNTYCHSDGTSVTTMAIPPNSSPVWSTTAVPLACNACHGNPPSYPQMTPEGVVNPKANAHGYHSLAITKFPSPGCQGCHYTTTTNGNTITNPSNHVNGQYDVVVMPGTVNFIYTPDPGGIGGYCTNVTCHGSFPNESFWGRYQAYIPAITITNGPGCYEASFSVTSMLNTSYPVQYLWDFGGGQTETGSSGLPIVTAGAHNYLTGAPRTITITGRDSSQRSFKKSQTFTPQPVGNKLPYANWEVTKNRYTVTVKDLSFDEDFDTCGNSLPGSIAIAWGDYFKTILNRPIDLTNPPSNKNYTFVYYEDPTISSDKTYTITHTIVDYAGAQASNSPQTKSVAVPGQTVISGRITRSDNGAAVAGVTVDLKYLQQCWITSNYISFATATTDASGLYSFSGQNYQTTYYCGNTLVLVYPYKKASLRIEPRLSDVHTFSPAYQDVAINRNDVNFTASP
jgi:predicted CxxxxCH...CXXCH cytochrome family protein